MIRGIGLRGAVAVNVITMIGIGPLITIPLVLAQLAGSLALIGWIAGALVALCDGLVWAELGSQFPGSGGTYVYLRETFGRDRWGRLFAFLFNWQFMLFAPLLLASGYIGFSNYAQYFWPNLTSWQVHAIAIAVGIVTTLVLLRPIRNISHVSQFLGLAAITTLLVVIAAALPHLHVHQAFAIPSGSQFGLGFLAGLGGALYITLYDYAGYGDAALLGEEVRNPHKTIPLAIVISIVLVALLYVALQTAVLGSTPWQKLAAHGGDIPAAGQYVASTIVEQSWGRTGGIVVTVLVLVTAFASVYGNLLGYSRIPFAAARDGVFFSIFDRLHPRYEYPYVSLLVIGALSLVASLFTLDKIIAVLSAGAILIQSVAQIVALAVLRARRGTAPFRMWLFPIPALIALIGWVYAFIYTGPEAMAIGVGWLVLGVAAFCILAWGQKLWPFAAMVLLLLLPLYAQARTQSPSRVEELNGVRAFTVDGRPFFVYGASFFYERVPRAAWARSLDAYRDLGINTIDLYVPWNWHELRDGDFDFTGRTNDRRDLLGLLAEIDKRGYRIILRPGPVIRNEWRNGGYPAWLLDRPEYDMPLHDVLEGRYPATATLQNTHSDDAAAEWMRNQTHMRYAARWLRTVLKTVAPYRRDIIAIALDDDQGAYIDNQTWPAPHFQRYIAWLQSIVRSTAGDVPTFINTYQMKVTASAPVWAWGNWYQSDAYSIGQHDRTQLEFSTGLLQTQPHAPVMIGEFQAGWLQNADEAHPRPADPTNTELALHTMLQMGAHGVVNFPVQDTFNPPGWEAPWANAFYDWDAAFRMDVPHDNPRRLPTQHFGTELRLFGAALAHTRPLSHVAIAWMPASFVRAPSNDQFGAAASAVQQEQRRCRSAQVQCDIVDPEFASIEELSRYDVLVVPGTRIGVRQDVLRKLDVLKHAGKRVVSQLDPRSTMGYRLPFSDAAVLTGDEDGQRVFLDIVNYSTKPRHLAAAYVPVGEIRFPVEPLVVAPRSALLIPLSVPLRDLGYRRNGLLRSTCAIVDEHISQSRLKDITAKASGPAGCTITISKDHGSTEVHLPAFTTTTLAADTFHIVENAPSALAASHCWTNAQLAVSQNRPFCVSVNRAKDGVRKQDMFSSGSNEVVFNTLDTLLAISPQAGARSFVLAFTPNDANDASQNAFSTVGGLRDDVSQQIPVSKRDYIGKYTHPIPAGTFNRPYSVTLLRTGRDPAAEFRYDAPDVLPNGATFDRIVSVDPNLDAFTVDERFVPHGPNVPANQQHIMRSSFAEGTSTVLLERTNAYAFWDDSTKRMAIVAWRTPDVTAHSIELHPGNYIVSLTFARRGWRRSAYALRKAPSVAEARVELRRFAEVIEREQGRGGSGANRR